MTTETAGSSQFQSARGPATRGGRHVNAGVCLFSIDQKHFAVSTGLVGEVTKVPSVVVVPQCPPAILGLFSLRGMPVAVVDLLVVLGQSSTVAPSGDLQVLVLSDEQGVIGGLRISRLDAVVPPERGRTRPTIGNEPAPITGIYETDGRPVSLLLGSDALVESFLKLSFIQAVRA
jgi:chemotaxis signal transduction protein